MSHSTEAEDFARADACWIWPTEGADGPNQYLEFRHEFTLPEADPAARLLISADTDYAVWVNGTFLDFGQYHDYPHQKTFDTLEAGLLIRPGSNVICFLVHYQGEGSFQYLKGAPGLLYVMRCADRYVASGRDTMCHRSAGYTEGRLPRVTPQLGFTFQYEAEATSSDWLLPEYPTGADWVMMSEGDLTPVSVRPIHAPRPVSKLRLGAPVPSRVVAQGLFRGATDTGTVAEQMYNATLQQTAADRVVASAAKVAPGPQAPLQLLAGSVGDAQGIYIILDLGREEAGILHLDLEALAGTVVDIAWGEHLQDGRVRAKIQERNFAGRYVCRGGRQSFTHHFLRMGGRYIQLHFSNMPQDVILHYAGLLPTEYPVEEKGCFSSPDELLNAIHRTGVRTLHLCMHEHYEDTPWREQALYAMDMRNQALCGYYCFADYGFAAASLDLLGAGLKADGYLELCAPAEIDITIPAFSMAWIMALADHLLYSGDTVFAQTQLSRVERMLGAYEETYADGLMPCPIGPRYWQFYEWAEGLDGTDHARQCSVNLEYTEAPSWYAILDRPRFDAPLNLFLCLAWEAASLLTRHCGRPQASRSYAAAAQQLRARVHARFWDADWGLYRTNDEEDSVPQFAELTQALALLAQVGPATEAQALRQRLARGGGHITRTTLSHSLYRFEALMQDPETYAPQVFTEMRRDWGHMLAQGATSFWETIRGASDFAGAGSLCHGWSAIPTYLLGAYVLGVKPLEPGFRTFSFRQTAAEADSVRGQVPTPHGPIRVESGMVHFPKALAVSRDVV